jgi:hypothetical protein
LSTLQINCLLFSKMMFVSTKLLVVNMSSWRKIANRWYITPAQHVNSTAYGIANEGSWNTTTIGVFSPLFIKLFLIQYNACTVMSEKMLYV